MTTTAQKKAYSDSYVAKGLCAKCRAPRDKSTHTCNKCLLKIRLRVRAKYNSLPYKINGKGRPPLIQDQDV